MKSLIAMFVYLAIGFIFTDQIVDKDIKLLATIVYIGIANLINMDNYKSNK